MNFEKFLQWLKLHGAFTTIQAVLKLCHTDIWNVCQNKAPEEWIKSAIEKMKGSRAGYHDTVYMGVTALCYKNHRVLFNLVDYDFDFKHLQYLWCRYLNRQHVAECTPVKINRDVTLRNNVSSRTTNYIAELERRQPIRTEMEKRAYFYRFEYGMKKKSE